MTTGDEHFYAQVGDELEAEQRDKGTWTKALAQSDFDENKARAAYVEMRVEQLKAEAARMWAEEATREVGPTLMQRLLAFKDGYKRGVEEARQEKPRDDLRE